MGNNTGDSHFEPLQQYFEPLRQYSCYLSPTLGKNSESKAEHKGRLWTIGMQVYTKLQRISHFISSLFFKGFSGREWVNNDWVMNKVKGNLSLLNKEIKIIKSDDTLFTKDYIALELNRIKEIQDICTILEGSVSNNTEHTTLTELEDNLHNIEKELDEIRTAINLQRLGPQKSLQRSTDEHADFIKPPKIAPEVQVPPHISESFTRALEKQSIAKEMRALIKMASPDPEFERTLAQKFSKLGLAQWSSDNRALRRVFNLEYTDETTTTFLNVLDRAKEVIKRAYTQMGKPIPATIQAGLDKLEPQLEKLHRLYDAEKCLCELLGDTENAKTLNKLKEYQEELPECLIKLAESKSYYLGVFKVLSIDFFEPIAKALEKLPPVRLFHFFRLLSSQRTLFFLGNTVLIDNLKKFCPLMVKRLSPSQIVDLLNTKTKVDVASKNPKKLLRSNTKLIRMVGGLKIDKELVSDQINSIMPDKEKILTKEAAAAHLPKIERLFGLNPFDMDPQFQEVLSNKDKTISDLFEKIITSKEEGLSPDISKRSMEYLLKTALSSLEFDDKEKELLELIRQEIHYDLELFDISYELVFKEAPEIIPPVAQHLTETLFQRIEQKANQKVGVFYIDSGYKHNFGIEGHLISIEIEKQQDKYIIAVANAGAGTLITSNDGKFCQSVRLYEINASEEGTQRLQQLLRDLINFKLKSYSASETYPEDYYIIFEKYTNERTDVRIPQRPIQEVGDCSIRSPEELIFNKLQRLGHHQLASKLQKHNLKIALESARDQYPALREIAVNKKARPDLEPFTLPP